MRLNEIELTGKIRSLCLVSLPHKYDPLVPENDIRKKNMCGVSKVITMYVYQNSYA